MKLPPEEGAGDGARDEPLDAFTKDELADEEEGVFAGAAEVVLAGAGDLAAPEDADASSSFS